MMDSWFWMRGQLLDFHRQWEELPWLRVLISMVLMKVWDVVTNSNMAEILWSGSPWFTRYTKPTVWKDSRMAEATPCLSCPSRNGLKSITLSAVRLGEVLQAILAIVVTRIPSCKPERRYWASRYCPSDHLVWSVNFDHLSYTDNFVQV